MNFLRKIFEETGKLVEKGKPLSWAYPVWEAADTIFFSTNKQTSKGPHIRDNMDIKRTMFFVVIALIPCYLFGAYNIGYLNALARSIEANDIDEMEQLGIYECDEEDVALCSFVCPSKSDVGAIIRKGLDTIYFDK